MDGNRDGKLPHMRDRNPAVSAAQCHGNMIFQAASTAWTKAYDGGENSLYFDCCAELSRGLSLVDVSVAVGA